MKKDTEKSLSIYLDFAKKLSQKAGEIMLKYFHEEIAHREKADKTLVTIADEEINEMVIDAVKKEFPAHAVLGEEASLKNNSKLAWVCDPIDGTFLFAKGIPLATFSIALVEDGAPVVGLVYDPFCKRIYSAIKGQGAFLNGKAIHVSNKPLDYRAALDSEDSPNTEYNFNRLVELGEKEKQLDFYAFGSSAFCSCLVACGSFEAVIFGCTKGKSVDIAASKVIVEEAGGKVTDIRGNEQRYDKDINGAVISNGKIHDELLDLIKRSLFS